MSAASSQDISGSLSGNGTLVLWGPFDFRGDTTPWKVAVAAAGNGTAASFRLIYEIFDGTNWSTVESVSSSAITQGANQSGTPTNRADTTAATKEWRCGSNCRVRLENLTSNTLNYIADVRTVQAG